MKFYHGVHVFEYKEAGETVPKFREVVSIGTSYDPQGLNVVFLPSNSMDYDARLMEVLIERGSPPMRLGKTGFIISIESQAVMFRLSSEKDATGLQSELTKALKGNESSVFAERTEDSSALQYFQFYGYLSQQQNMMQDYIRTATYQKAIHENLRDFADKVILDVGAGSGILSFFAVQAGAKKVYAVEASSIAPHCEALSNFNGLKGKLIVLPGKIEEIELPEKVDCIISEPMGYMLYNERMLESYLHAKKWLKPGGKMFPSRGDLHVAPFTDEALFLEQQNKAAFWQQTSFHGVNLSCLKNVALKEYFRQPIVDTFDVRICLAKSTKHCVDFITASEFDLHEINIPVCFEILKTGTVHGLAFWFDVAFEGSSSTIWLSTSPTEPLTHWYQVRCLIEEPILCVQGQLLKGKVVLQANKRQSYDVLIELETNMGLRGPQKATNTLDLKNPYFRYTGQAPQPPPGHHTTAPSDGIWATADNATRIVNGIATMNGSVVDAMGNIIEMPTPGTVMSVLPGNVVNQQNSTLAHAHYTTVPIIGDYMSQQSLLLSNTNVNGLPTANGVMPY